MKAAKKIMFYLAVIYLFFMAYAWFYSDNMIFVPHATEYQDSTDTIKLTCADGVEISAVYLESPGSEFTFLYSHGNGEDLGDMLPFLAEYPKNGYSVLAYDYRGYGTSEGRPSEKGAYLDVDAAYDYLVNEAGVLPESIIVLGRSVGSGPSTYIASKRDSAGLVLISPFISAFRVMTVVPLFPFDKFNNIRRIGNVKVPLLVVHGTEDPVVPFWHGRKLYEKANEPKYSRWIEAAGHNEYVMLGGEEYWEIINEFTGKLRGKL